MDRILFAAQVEGIATRKDRTITVKLGTQELSPSVSSELFRLQNALCYVMLKTDAPSSEDMEIIDELSTGNKPVGKTQSQRLRSVYFLLWKQDNEEFSEFQSYYEHKMESSIINLKSKLSA